MLLNSDGTPGVKKHKARLILSAKPQAVPFLLSIIIAPSGSIACLILVLGMTRPRALCQLSSLSSHCSFKTCLTPQALAAASVVLSSEVGPKPPFTKSKSQCLDLSLISEVMSSRLSPTL